MKSSRQIAAETLVRCERGGYSQLAFDVAIQKEKLLPRDVAFAGSLFYGALERKLTLDHCIDKYAKHPLTDEIRAVLRVAFYQLIYMDSVPARAAVDQAVKDSRAMRQSSAAGMVNGILRSFLRDGCAIPPAGDGISGIGIQFSCNQSIVEKLVDWFGEERTLNLLEASMGQPPVFLRVNSLKTGSAELLERLTQEGFSATVGPLPNCLIADGDLAHSKAFAQGFFHIQDISSQQAALLIEAKPGERVLDVCAAPGSKSCLVAEQMQNNGEVLACDISEKRLGLIKKTAERLGIETVKARQNDATVYNEELGLFDWVLCDVPCSGLGVLRRKPELKYRNIDAAAELPALQYKILKTSSAYCKKDGMLVYSTCTLNPEENEKLLSRFLSANPNFRPAPFIGDVFFQTILPTKDGGDGFFFSRIRRVV